ncbi:tripartite tricarboxylate transporter TctB family protein [Salinicola peritrichatus]|uniref:tripartite tricarboxylate transporter TctB family protein n=1 Tax=Salinicola peritrichatus TaxID=1267424 RepID=UPI000DA2299B|nr:tripartite tricarboxylate transporter TctB family protein [Salinicola peritrichatus]
MSPKRLIADGRFVVPAVLTIVTVVYLIEAIRIGPPMKGGNMTPAFFPIAIAIVTLIALACAMVQAIRGMATQAESEDRPRGGISAKALAVTLITAAYLAAFDVAGYFVATFFYVLLLSVIFGGRRGWPFKLLAAVVITALGFGLFELVFQVRLPTLWSQ